MKIDTAEGMPYKIRFSTRSPAQPIHVRPEVSAMLAKDDACYWVLWGNWWRKRSKEMFPRENLHVFRCMCPVLDCQVLEHGSLEASLVEATSCSGDGALDIWGEAETAESSQNTEKMAQGKPYWCLQPPDQKIERRWNQAHPEVHSYRMKGNRHKLEHGKFWFD